jgi:hypothetical protein
MCALHHPRSSAATLQAPKAGDAIVDVCTWLDDPVVISIPECDSAQYLLKALQFDRAIRRLTSRLNYLHKYRILYFETCGLHQLISHTQDVDHAESSSVSWGTHCHNDRHTDSFPWAIVSFAFKLLFEPLETWKRSIRARHRCYRWSECSLPASEDRI